MQSHICFFPSTAQPKSSFGEAMYVWGKGVAMDTKSKSGLLRVDLRNGSEVPFFLQAA